MRNLLIFVLGLFAWWILLWCVWWGVIGLMNPMLWKIGDKITYLTMSLPIGVVAGLFIWDFYVE